MKEAEGDLWLYPADWRVITTNGYVKRNGAAVMGRGCAFQAKKKFPGLEFSLGREIKEHGNLPVVFENINLITLPVKDNWWAPAELVLIDGMLCRLASMFDKINRVNHPYFKDTDTVVLPRPGCGAGQLVWEDVKPICEMWLDDRFTVITFKEGSHEASV